MCLAIPGAIVRFVDEHHVEVDFGGVRKTVVSLLLEDPRIGEHVLVHAGYAITKINRADAEATRALLDEIDSLPTRGP